MRLYLDDWGIESETLEVLEIRDRLHDYLTQINTKDNPLAAEIRDEALARLDEIGSEVDDRKYYDFPEDDSGREYLECDIGDDDCLDDVAKMVAELFQESPFYRGQVQDAFALFGIRLEGVK